VKATTCTKRRQGDTQAITQVKRLSLVKIVRGPTRSNTWKAIVGNRKQEQWLLETSAGSESMA
jgi:hypothetical protein